MTTAGRLKAAHSAVAQAQGSMTSSKRELLSAVRQARAEGMTYEEIGAELGVGKSRVQALVRQADKELGG